MRRLIVTIISLAIIWLPMAVGQTASTPALKTPKAKSAVIVPAVKSETALPVSDEKAVKVEITAVRWANHVDAITGLGKLRMVFDLTGPIKLETTVTGTPVPQLTVDIQGASPGNISDAYTFDGRIAELLTIAATGPATTRIALQLPLMVEESDYKVFMLRNDPANNKPHRIVIDISQKVPPAKYTFTAGLKNKIIAIDPGHGGSDPGAIGPNKTQEKTITLAVAQRLRALLEKAGAKVLMTRTDDRDVFSSNASAVDELKARATVGNNKKADVFISIHINAFTNPSAGGTSTHYYQKTYYDALLANSIQSFIVPAGGLRDRGALAANFYVVKRTIMPAVLTELAFVSNPDEEKLMNTPDFQQKMAQGMYLGLEKFFAQAARLGGGR